MQTAANNPCAAPQRDIDTIVLEARHLLNTSKPLEQGKRPTYPRDAVTISRVLALREESGLPIDRFCDRVRVSQATFFCWQNGQTGGGKDWPDLKALQLAKRSAATMAAVSSAAEVSASMSVEWSIPAASPVTDLVGDAAKRLEALRQSPPQVAPASALTGAAPSKVEVALLRVKEEDEASYRVLSNIRAEGVTIFRNPDGTEDRARTEAAVVLRYADGMLAELAKDRRQPEVVPNPTGRIKGEVLIAARDEAYARFQAATERMPAAEAAADLVSIYRRSHRGLPGFARGHYDAEMMAKRVEQWTAGRDEEGEQWDRLIGLLTTRGIKPSINGLGKRAAKALRVVKPADDAPEMALIRPARGFLDLRGNFHAIEAEALTSSWNILVQEKTDEILTQAARAGVTLRSFLMSDEAVKPTDDLARALKGREAHQCAAKGP